MKRDPIAACLVFAVLSPATAQQPSTAPLFGGGPSRNMVNLIDKNVPTEWSILAGKQKNVKWTADLGSKSYGGPVVAGGRVYIGTNNPRGTDEKKDHQSVLMCFSEKDGKLLWAARHPAPQGNIYEHVHNMGLLSTPVVDGQRVFYVLPQGVVVCASVEDGRAIWQYDMGKKLGVVPFHCCNCSPLVVGKLLFLVTGNGIDEQKKKVRDRNVPSFIALRTDTGELAWKNSLPGDSVIEGQWSNPAYAVIQGKPQVIFPGGDAVLYSFDPESGKLLWKCSCLPKKLNVKGGKPYIIATPVIHDSKVYVALGVYPGGHPDPPRHSFFLCIDATRSGDISPVSFDLKAAENKNSGVLWVYGGKVGADKRTEFGSSISTCAVHDGLVFIAEEASYVHCLDAATGKLYWTKDMQNTVWGSPYYVDGKVFLCTEEGNVVIFEASKKYKEIARIDMDIAALHGTPVVAGGVLYIVTPSKLYAIAEKK